MTNCRYCKSEFQDGAKFCPKCGGKAECADAQVNGAIPKLKLEPAHRMMETGLSDSTTAGQRVRKPFKSSIAIPIIGAPLSLLVLLIVIYSMMELTFCMLSIIMMAAAMEMVVYLAPFSCITVSIAVLVLIFSNLHLSDKSSKLRWLSKLNRVFCIISLAITASEFLTLIAVHIFIYAMVLAN